MKKNKRIVILSILVLIVATIFIGGIFSKSSESVKATIITRSGETEQLSKRELKEIYNENEAKFEKSYLGAEISFVGTVSKVEYDFFEQLGSGRTSMDAIILKEGFKVYLPHDLYDMTEFSKGDKVYVCSNIYSAFSGNYIDLRGTGGSIGFNETSLKTTIIKNVTGKSEEEINDIKETIVAKKDLYAALEMAEDKLDFINKYAGNTSASGSRKFADEFLNEFKTCLDKTFNFELIGKEIPDIKLQVENIKSNNTSIYNMLVDMGNTNSAANVPTIKNNARDNLRTVQELMKKLK